jgi:hypothetical protein
MKKVSYPSACCARVREHLGLQQVPPFACCLRCAGARILNGTVVRLASSTSARRRRRAAAGRRSRGIPGWQGALLLHEFAVVVVPVFASVVEFDPRTFWAQAVSVASVPIQAAYTTIPISRKMRGE